MVEPTMRSRWYCDSYRMGCLRQYETLLDRQQTTRRHFGILHYLCLQVRFLTARADLGCRVLSQMPLAVKHRMQIKNHRYWTSGRYGSLIPRFTRDIGSYPYPFWSLHVPIGWSQRFKIRQFIEFIFQVWLHVAMSVDIGFYVSYIFIICAFRYM